MSDILDRPISNYSDELFHYNVKGTNWYTHKFGNWERHAKYANGQPNPETKGSKGPYSSESARDKYLAKRDRKKGAYDAKRDAAINVLNNRNNHNFKQRFKASSEMNKISDHAKGALAAELGIGAGTYLATGSLDPIVLATFASPVSATIPVGTIAGAIAYDEYKQYKSRKGYKERYKNGAKDFEKGLSKSTIKDLGLSKEYVDSYSKTMNEALKTYDKLGSTGKTKVSGKDIKYTGPKQKSNPESDAKRGSYDANRDLAIQLLSKGETYSPLQQAQANRDLNLLSDKLAGSLIGTTVSAATGGSVRGSAAAGYVGGRINDIFMENRQIAGYNKRHNDNLRYRDVRFNGLTMGTRYKAIQRGKKKFNTALSKSTIKDLGLSKEYVQAYSDTMNIALRKYDSLGNKLYR